MQNNLARFIAGVMQSESVVPLHESLGIIKRNGKYLVARFMYKYCVGMVPQLVSSYFIRKYYVSSYDLRSTNCLHLPIVTSDPTNAWLTRVYDYMML